MSIPKTTTVTCKQCGAEGSFTAWQSLNVTLNRQEKAELMSGALTKFVCPKCNWSADVVYPLLYHDMEKKLMIWLWPGTGEPETGGMPFRKGMQEYRYRIVGSRVELMEKVFIFDAGLDDRVIEMMKLVARVQPQAGESLKTGVMLFARVAEEGAERRVAFEHLQEGKNQSFTLPYELYEKLAASIASKVESKPQDESTLGPWLRVGQDYALALMSKR